MTRQETRLNAAIDRKTGKAQTSARTLQVRDAAKEAVNAFVMALPEEDRPEGMNAAIRHLRTLYGAGEGEAEAVALYGSLAFSKVLTVRGVVARAQADRIARTLFRDTANENSGGEG